MSVWLPVVIVVGSLALIAVVHLVTRGRPTAADVDVPGDTAAAPPVDARVLAAWHHRHEAALLDWLEHHDGNSVGTVAGRDGLVEAIAEHPDPVARAELSALAVAAEATTAALGRADHRQAARQHELYVRYRRLWLERIWQFRRDDDRVSRLATGADPELPAADHPS